MLEKIKNYIKYSYHRPTAKIEHFCVLFFKLFLNKKTILFSEKLMLLKFPPISIIYFNAPGRFFYAMVNFIYIILFKRFFDKSLFIETLNNKFKEIKIGNNSSPWPQQAIHLFEKNEEKVKDNFFDEMKKSYEKSIEELNKTNFKDSAWWMELRKEFKEIFLKDNKLNQEALINFRNNVNSKAAILKDQNYAVSEKNSKFRNMINTTLFACLYHKYSEVMDVNILRLISDSQAGNNKCIIYRGQRLNHRILRYAYYVSQLKKNLSFKSKEKVKICDIGGGYGGLLRLLKHIYLNASCILVELPETCLLASYFLKKNFPNKKILLYSQVKDEAIKFSDYDFVILPQTAIGKIADESIDLVINTSSLSEMENETQNFYMNEIERITKSYFYSVNRHGFKMHKYNAQGFYNLKFNKRWNSLIYKFTHTYQLEFLGERIK